MKEIFKADECIEELFELTLERYSRSQKARRDSVILFFEHPLSVKHDPMTMSVGKKLDSENKTDYELKVQIKSEGIEVPIYTNSLRKYLLEHALTAHIIASSAQIRTI